MTSPVSIKDAGQAHEQAQVATHSGWNCPKPGKRIDRSVCGAAHSSQLLR
jgi:hypothetical protein